MSARFACERCAQAFDSDDARCPKCLRKSSVRAVGERSSTSDAARLASGDTSQSTAGRRATALVIAIVLSALLVIGLSLAWSTLAALRVIVPAGVAASIAVMAWIRAALADAPDEAWGAFASRVLVGLGLATWAFVAGVLALASTSGLSAPLAVVIGVLVFLGGVVPVLRWMQRREDAPAPPPSGKWR